MNGKFSHDVVLENINYAKSRIEEAAKKSGRNPRDVVLLAATKSVGLETLSIMSAEASANRRFQNSRPRRISLPWVRLVRTILNS